MAALCFSLCWRNTHWPTSSMTSPKTTSAVYVYGIYSNNKLWSALSIIVDSLNILCAHVFSFYQLWGALLSLLPSKTWNHLESLNLEVVFSRLSESLTPSYIELSWPTLLFTSGVESSAVSGGPSSGTESERGRGGTNAPRTKDDGRKTLPALAWPLLLFLPLSLFPPCLFMS